MMVIEASDDIEFRRTPREERPEAEETGLVLYPDEIPPDPSISLKEKKMTCPCEPGKKHTYCRGLEGVPAALSWWARVKNSVSEFFFLAFLHRGG